MAEAETGDVKRLGHQCDMTNNRPLDKYNVERRRNLSRQSDTPKPSPVRVSMPGHLETHHLSSYIRTRRVFHTCPNTTVPTPSRHVETTSRVGLFPPPFRMVTDR